MIEMPPLQFAQVNVFAWAITRRGPKSDKPPVILCHGWPEIAFSWRHQIKALSEAGIRVIAPDQRGYGATDRPEPVEAYDMEHLTGDLVGLLDHLKIDKAIFVGHDWGGFIVWQMPLRHPIARRRRRRRQHAALGPRAGRSDRAVSPALRRQDVYRAVPGPGREPDRIFGSRVEQTFDAFMRKPVHAAKDAGRTADRRRRCLAQTQSGVSADDRDYDAKHDPRTPILSPEEKKVFVDTFTKTGFTGGINWYRNFYAQLAALERARSSRARSVADDHGRERRVLPPSAADGMEKIVPDLEKYLVRDSGHWTQQEKAG
jgi:pimeloyl-ACP methyl ester carboxylesterase